MQIYVNSKRITNRAKIGRRASLAGLLILGLGMLASLAPGYIATRSAEHWLQASPLGQWLMGGGWLYISMTALLLGFFLGQIGNANMRRFQKSPRPDEVVARALKGFDDRNHLYAFATPGDLVFAGPAGLYAIVTRDLDGELKVINNRIKQAFHWRRFFAFGQEAPGLPVADAEVAAQKVSEWLHKQGATTEPPAVQPLVIFTNDKAQLEVQSASQPVMHHKQLKQYLRNELRAARVSKTDLASIVEHLDAEAQRRGAQIA